MKMKKKKQHNNIDYNYLVLFPTTNSFGDILGIVCRFQSQIYPVIQLANLGTISPEVKLALNSFLKNLAYHKYLTPKKYLFNPSSGVSWRHSTFRDLKKLSVAIEKNPTPANVKACQIVVENILPELETVGLSRHFTETNEESLFRNSLSKNDNSPWEASIGLPSRYTVNLSCIGNKSLSATPRLWVRRHTTGLSYNFHWGLNPEPRYMLCYKQYHFGFCNNLTRPRFVIGRTFQANKIKTELSIHASIPITQKKKIFIDNSDIFFQVKKIFEPKEFYVYDKKLGFTIPVSADFNTALKTINPRNRFFLITL